MTTNCNGDVARRGEWSRSEGEDGMSQLMSHRERVVGACEVKGTQHTHCARGLKFVLES